MSAGRMVADSVRVLFALVLPDEFFGFIQQFLLQADVGGVNL
jgi:hypothetical protein